MDPNKIKRINQLAKKSKEEALTPEEIKERDNLRKEYIQGFRSNLKATLDSCVVVDEDGNKKNLKN